MKRFQKEKLTAALMIVLQVCVSIAKQQPKRSIPRAKRFSWDATHSQCGKNDFLWKTYRRWRQMNLK